MGASREPTRLAEEMSKGRDPDDHPPQSSQATTGTGLNVYNGKTPINCREQIPPLTPVQGCTVQN
jgi:hypothetical protein